MACVRRWTPSMRMLEKACFELATIVSMWLRCARSNARSEALDKSVCVCDHLLPRYVVWCVCVRETVCTCMCESVCLCVSVSVFLCQ